jgi:hypothetical protein
MFIRRPTLLAIKPLNDYLERNRKDFIAAVEAHL